MNIILSVFSVSVILIVSLIGVGVFKAFKAFMGVLDNFVEKYVPKKDSITVEITKELVESFAEEFGYVVKDYDQLMKIIRKNVWSKSYSSGNGYLMDIMVQIFSIAVEERVVFNTLENTFTTMLKESSSDEEECLGTNTVFEEAASSSSDNIIKAVDYLTQNKVKAENGDSEVNKKMLLRRG